MNAIAETPPLRSVALPSSPDRWPADATAFLRGLAGPAWIRQPGRDRSRHRVVSTLLHGNEPSGTRAVLSWLRSGAVPAVDTSFFLGSIAAALEPPAFSHRVLFGHHDLNRCFLPPFDGGEGALAEEVLRRIRSVAPEALVDLHNTTGATPAYGVGPGRDRARLALTALFADRYVHSDLKLGALIEAVQDAVPSVVIECGRADDERADRVASDGLVRFLTAESLAPEALGADRKRIDDITVVGEPVRVCLQPGRALRYGEIPDGALPDADSDLTIDLAIDRHNFELVAPGTPIGWMRPDRPWPFVATRADGAEVSHELLKAEGARIEARRAFVPIMMTTDPEIAVQDCIFYA
ncbi:MAG: succinylglutamate desuccinylase, partial [Myxococcales bacterium]|nr:succinylglutamate desuccinylase [Myxococcales bacterium]